MGITDPQPHEHHDQCNGSRRGLHNCYQRSHRHKRDRLPVNKERKTISRRRHQQDQGDHRKLQQKKEQPRNYHSILKAISYMLIYQVLHLKYVHQCMSMKHNRHFHYIPHLQLLLDQNHPSVSHIVTEYYFEITH